MELGADALEDLWKTGGETEEEDESDFYFSIRGPSPPKAPAAPIPPSNSTCLSTPDTSFQQFDDSNSLDTTPRVGKNTRKAWQQQEQPQQLESFPQVDMDSMFPSSFPSAEFLAVVSQQVEQHSVRH